MSLLMIGYGSELHGDDGVGPRAARAIAGWGLPGVETVAAPLLVPEMADRLRRHDYALFIDARVGAVGRIALVELEPTPSARLGHVSSPADLLALALLAYGRAPRAWLLAVPGQCFDLGDGLSPTAERGLRRALGRARRLIDRYAVAPAH